MSKGTLRAMRTLRAVASGSLRSASSRNPGECPPICSVSRKSTHPSCLAMGRHRPFVVSHPRKPVTGLNRMRPTATHVDQCAITRVGGDDCVRIKIPFAMSCRKPDAHSHVSFSGCDDKGSAMDRAEEYLANAAACQRKADATERQDIKHSWLALARSWLRLVHSRERLSTDARDAESHAGSIGREKSKVSR